MQININQTAPPTTYKCLVGYYSGNLSAPNPGVSFFLSYYSSASTNGTQLNFSGFLPDQNYFVRLVDSVSYYDTHSFGNGASTVGIYDEFGPLNFSQPSAITSITSQTNLICNGGSNGTATANTSGGTPFA